MQCYRGRMHPRIGTASTKYTTRKTRTPNAKYYYKPEELGCIKSLRRPIFFVKFDYIMTRQVPLPPSSEP